MPRSRQLPAQIASDLRYHQRVMLFCLASGDDWKRAGVTHATVQYLLERGLINHASTSVSYDLTRLGRRVLAMVNEED